MSVRVRAAVALLAVAVTRVHPAAAQDDTTADGFWEHPIHVSGSAGIAQPTGIFRNNFEAAWDGAVGLAWPVTPGSGVWIEGNANYEGQLLTDQTLRAYAARGGGANIVSGTVNLVLNKRHLLFDRVSPYVVGGGGIYSRAIELDDFAGTSACSPFIGFCGVYGMPAVRTRTQWAPGWDAGAGLRVRVSALRLFAEARYNDMYTRHGATTFVPILVGSQW